MKNLVILALVTVIALSLGSCSNDLLNLNNPNALVSETSWTTQSDVEKGLTGAYHTLYNSFYNGFNAFLIDGQSDEFYSQSPDADLAALVNLKYDNYSQRWNLYSWQYLYQSVFRCNQVIVFADQVAWDNETTKNEVVAQARALRAMNYYYLGMLYKKAPIVDWISSPDDKPKEATFEEICDFVEKDLKFAQNYLPEKWKEPGRVNKDFATCFLGKLYMNSGRFAEAKEEFAKIVKSGRYQLTKNYRDNFRHDTENNCESIWETQNSDEVQNWGGYWSIPNDGSECCFASYREKFLAASPGGWGDYSVYQWMVDMYKDEKTRDGHYDTRLRDNIVYPDLFKDFPGEKVYMEITQWDNSHWSNRCWCRKYTTDYYRKASEVTQWSPINQRILRYGDILLCYAECLIESEGASAIPEATKYVDMIRERVNLYPLAESVHKDCLKSLDAFKKRLRIEREKETCFEYDRFFDMRRYGLGTDEDYTNSVKARCQKFQLNWKNGHQWLPIPTSDVANNPNLTQNEGY